eukprot:TRINITY_DN28210_c0_g1_i1.p1 TRINITY_DN28210_c0_g1~~TRINITY_DN28210_c0_g1_i1.p1  ORF type:complete len:245 (-),score=29.23 TRINITY_DN28210_c0_g1_i1:235-969(-)
MPQRWEWNSKWQWKNDNWRENSGEAWDGWGDYSRSSSNHDAEWLSSSYSQWPTKERRSNAAPYISQWQAERSESADASGITSAKVLIIGDSFVRGLNKFITGSAKRWRVDAYEGQEALSVACEKSMLEEYDHVVYATAGNGIWKDVFEAVRRNISTFDSSRVSVVFFGSAAIWGRMAESTWGPVKYPSFMEDAKRLLQDAGVRFVEVTSFVEGLEYVEGEDHPTKQARWDVAAKLIQVIPSLVV